MSFGSLSSAAIESLNYGAKLGNFAHNTGEGGISPHHLKYGGDLIYQIGTGYFGCRDKDGNFNAELFSQRTADDRIKMIEIKLSQGAKPGHGGILPAKKATPEIAAIRNIEPYKDVISPPFHKAFSNPIEMLQFIKKCRDLSGGKPIGFKLCVGLKSEFIAICKAMIETGIKPDFISVDGGEGGTGAAPLEFSNSVGMPFKEGLTFVYDTLVGFNLKKEITLIAAGKISTGYHMYRAFAMGADVCYSARAMMMALGCIQALECNKNTCPVGVATQDPELIRGLDVEDKKVRVFNYHKSTIKSFVELMAASGLSHYDQINRSHVSRRVGMTNVQRYDQIYPYIAEGCLLQKDSVPDTWLTDWAMATSKSFLPRFDQVYIEED
jgi:glutamate synthase domain-containing protein 2